MQGKLISFILKRDEVSHHNSQTDGWMSLWKYGFGHAYNFGICSGIDWISMESIING